MNEKEQISREGYEKYKEELMDLKGRKREEIAQKIKEAREQGDISDNGEYESVKEEQLKIEARIEKLEEFLRSVEVVDKDDLKRGVIGIGSHVKLYDQKNNEEIEYDIVGEDEADSLNGKISNKSPLGNALIGKRKGDKVEVPLPKGKLKLEVIKVQKQ